jgi:hypothetical protein
MKRGALGAVQVGMASDPPQLRSGTEVFEQTQYMSRMVLVVILCLEVPTLAMMFGFYYAGMFPGWVLLLVVGMPILLVWMVWWSRLRVRVAPDRLRWSFRPFWFSSVDYDKISGVTTMEVDPVRDFGGWGVRLGKGTYAAIAKKGGAVRIQRIGKKRDLVLGSDDAEALANAILDRALSVEGVGGAEGVGGVGGALQGIAVEVEQA